jgi:hypothetical protein
MAKKVLALGNIALENADVKVFLAGSMDRNWQDELMEKYDKVLANSFTKTIAFINPRRRDWDASWNESYKDANFYQQVKWELSCMEQADYVVVNITADSKAPISLLELGIQAKSGKLLVRCEDGFWKKGNVDIVCEQYGIKQFSTIDDIVSFLIAKVRG